MHNEFNLVSMVSPRSSWCDICIHGAQDGSDRYATAAAPEHHCCCQGTGIRKPSLEVTRLAKFSEFEDVLDARPLGQGDLLRPLEPSKDPWEGMLIVVTADCDLAKYKHAGRLSCVPVLPADTYLAIFYMPKRIEKIRNELGQRLVNLTRKAQSDNLAEFTQPVSADRATQWILQSDPDRICETLKLSPAERDTFLPMTQVYRSCAEAVSRTLTEQCDIYSMAAEVLYKSGNTARKNLISDLAGHLKQLPGDAMFLNYLLDDGARSGYVAYLRVLRELKENAVAVRSSSRSYEISHERTAHLKPPYLYHLTQRLGAVFSSIGLPDEYEAERNTRFSELMEGLV
jgi:hypothetical protein